MALRILMALALVLVGLTAARAGKGDRCCQKESGLMQRVYSVADLVVPIDGCPKPAAKPGPTSARRATPTIRLGANPHQTTEDELIELIRSTIAPKSWSNQGGVGTIEYFPLGMGLVVNQTPDLHEQIADLLAALRRLQDVEIVLEVRLLTLAEGFCERGGIDRGTKGEKHEPRCGSPLTVTFLNDKQLFSFMEAAQGDRRTGVLQAPKMTLFNGQMATIDGTEQQTFVTSMEVVSSGKSIVFVPRNEVIPLGLHMTVQAVASADCSSVRLNLRASLTELEGSVPVVSVTAIGATGADAPALVSCMEHIQMPHVRAVLSCEKSLQIPCGGTALLTGDWKRMCESRQEFEPPVLSKIPYLSRLFKNVGYSRETEEVALLITPRINVQNEKVERVGIDFNGLSGAPGAAVPVACPGVMPASRSTPSSAGTSGEPLVIERKSLRPTKAGTTEQRKVARLLEKYHQACLEGRLEAARELASRALAIDATCFSRNR